MIFLNFHIVMSSVTATIQERFESGQSPSQICKLSKGLTSRSGAYKALKRFRETGSALQRISGTPDRKIRTSTLVKSSQEKISRNPQRSIRKLASASLWAMERCRKCSQMTWTFLHSKRQKLSYSQRPQKRNCCKEQRFFWRSWETARNLRS